MYARSTTVRGEPRALDDGIAFVRHEVMPHLQVMFGYVGLSMLCDRDSGRCVITSSWVDEMAMHATEQSVVDLRRRTAEILRGEYETQPWEVAIVHRAHEGHDGARARVSWVEGNPMRTDENLATFRSGLLPRLEELPGFCSVSVLMDRATGFSATTVIYDSREDMQRGQDVAQAMREEFGEAMGVRITEVADFDLALHHLRVPETA
jgi:heme-degrading monooxygenase HmoA